MRVPPAIISPGEAPPARGKYVIAVPGQLAPLQRFDLPSGVSGPARLAIAVEQLSDRIGSAAEGVSLVPLGVSQWDRALVCDTVQLQAWCDTEAARDARCLAVLPDMLTLPSAEKTLVVETRDATLLARSGDGDGFTAPAALAAPLLRQLIAESAPTSLHVIDSIPSGIRDQLDQLNFEPASELPGWSVPAVDLRAARRGSGDAGALRLWAASGLVALLAFGMWVTSLWAEIRGLREDAAEVRVATTALLREDLIPTGPILDIRQQVTQAMALQADDNRSDTKSPADLLSRATVALFGTGIEVGTIAFDRTTAALVIDVTADTFAEVDRLVTTLNAGDLDATATDMRNATDGGVSARLQLKFAEAAQ